MIAMKLLVRHHVGEPDLWCPVFVCDECGRYIEDPAMGLVVFTSDERGTEPGCQVAARVMHKGTCDRSGPGTSWSELTDVAEQLARNTENPITKWGSR